MVARTDGRTDERTDGRTDGRIDTRSGGRIDDLMVARTDDSTDRSTNEHTDRSTNGRTDARTDGRRVSIALVTAPATRAHARPDSRRLGAGDAARSFCGRRAVVGGCHRHRQRQRHCPEARET